MGSSRLGLTAIVITLNEEQNIAACLESLAFADEVVVLDSGSTDATVAIAGRYPARVCVEPFEGHVELRRNHAASLASNDWVLMVDADERVTPELAGEIEDRLPLADCAAFRCSIREFMYGGPVDHGGWEKPNYIRLYRRSKARWSGAVHERVAVDGKIGLLENGIVHFSHVSVSTTLDKMNRYTTVEARQLAQAGRKPRLWLVLPRFLWTLAGRLIWRGGYRDGARGFVVAFLMAVYYAVRELKLWDLTQAKEPTTMGCRGPLSSADPLNRLHKSAAVDGGTRAAYSGCVKESRGAHGRGL